MFSGKYDADCMAKLLALAEVASDIAGVVTLGASIIGMWFIGCGLA